MAVVRVEIEGQEEAAKYADDLIGGVHIGELNDLLLFDLLVEDVQRLRRLEALRLELATLVPANALIPARVQRLQTRGRHVHALGIFAAQLDLQEVVGIEFFVSGLLRVILLSWRKCVHVDVLQPSAHEDLVFVLGDQRTEFVEDPDWRAALR